MTIAYVELDGKRQNTVMPVSLEKYLIGNCKRADTTESKFVKESLAAGLIPIAVGIVGGAVATWWVTKEQKSKILEFLQ